MAVLLYILAVLLFVGGVWQLFLRNYLWGAILIVLAFLVGPGGVSFWNW